MKIYYKLISAVLSFSIIASSAVCSAAKAEYELPDEIPVIAETQSVPVIDGSHYCASVEEAARYLREQYKQRVKNIDYYFPTDGFEDYDEAEKAVSLMAISETYKGNEGDYLKYSLQGGSSIMTLMRNPDKPNSFYLRVKASQNYRTTLEQEQYVDTKVSQILKSLNIEGKSDYEKIQAIYGYIIANVTYDYSSSDKTVYTAYAALSNGKCVCAGFSQLFYRLCKDSGVSARIIVGDAGESHAWNIAAVNGIYYLCDTTFDEWCSGLSKCHYFMKGTSDFDAYKPSTPHVPTALDDSGKYVSAEFAADFPISKTAYNASNPQTGYTLGDINSDKLIDSSDASDILIAYSNLSTGKVSGLSKARELAADVNGDGTIDSSDASDVLRYFSHVSTGGSLSLKEFLNQ